MAERVNLKGACKGFEGNPSNYIVGGHSRLDISPLRLWRHLVHVEVPRATSKSFNSCRVGHVCVERVAEMRNKDAESRIS